VGDGETGIVSGGKAMDPLTAFSEEERGQALERFQKLRPHLEEDINLVEVAAQAHIPLRTAQRWVALYRQHGLAGLTRKHRADDGEPRRISRELQELIEGLALQTPRVSAAVIHRRVSLWRDNATNQSPPIPWSTRLSNRCRCADDAGP